MPRAVLGLGWLRLFSLVGVPEVRFPFAGVSLAVVSSGVPPPPCALRVMGRLGALPRVPGLRAAWFMLGSVLGMSLSPLALLWAGAAVSPFFFNSAWRLGSFCGCLLVLAVFFRPVLWAPL